MLKNNNQFLIVIGGPTAVGKSSLAVEIAQKYRAEIISADSRQVYLELTQGTAKPTIEQQNTVKHHYIDHISINTPYSAGDFEREATATINTLFKKDRVVVVVGGSGLHINAIVHGLDVLPEIDPEIRLKLNNRLKEQGIEVLLDELASVDPEFSIFVDKKNPRRIIRALEVYYSSSVPYSQFRIRLHQARPYSIVMIGLEIDRAILYDQINSRVDQMVKNGLIEEAKELYPQRDLPALQTVGYSEFFGHFDGKYDLEEAIRLVKRNSRRYAKRQLTWFKNQENMQWFKSGDQMRVLEYLDKMIPKE